MLPGIAKSEKTDLCILNNIADGVGGTDGAKRHRTLSTERHYSGAIIVDNSSVGISINEDMTTRCEKRYNTP